MSGSPMDPERLAKLRRWPQAAGDGDVAELLADRDHLVTRLARCAMELGLERGKAQRYRSGCPVTTEDVEAAGVTRTKALAWRDRQEHADPPQAGRKLLAKYINEHAAAYGEPAFDILDEMAKEPAR